MLKLINVSKSYGSFKAIENINMEINKGEILGFIGKNGAGKSTTISIICGLLQKEGGIVSINGVDLDENADAIKRDLGVVFQSSVLDKVLSVKDNLRYRAALYGITGKEFEERLATLSEMLEFSDLLRRPVGKLSGGQRRRIDVARAL